LDQFLHFSPFYVSSQFAQNRIENGILRPEPNQNRMCLVVVEAKVAYGFITFTGA